MKDRFNGLLQRLAIDWSQLVWINSESNSMIFCLQQCNCSSVHVLTGLHAANMQRFRMHDAVLLTLMVCVTAQCQAAQTGLTEAIISASPGSDLKEMCK